MVALPRPAPRRAPVLLVLGALGAAAIVALFGLEMRDAAAARLLAHPWWIALACTATAVSLLAAVYNLTAFTPHRLPLRDTLRAQLAVCGLRVIAPSALSTPAICTRYLTRSGLGVAESMAVVGTAQAAQLAMTVVVVVALAATGARQLHAPDPAQCALYAAVAVGALLIVAILAWRVPLVRRGAGAARRALADVIGHARQRPLKAAGGLGASAALTTAHVSAFACCVAAAGGHASLLTLSAVYLGAASAGSLIPTPAGLGAVEAAMIAGLAAAGVDAATATAATLLTRVVTVWALALPGWVALRSLRRRGLL